MMNNIDKNKLVLIRDSDERIIDQPLETKEIGYYKDSWNRFKKNKASLAAFVIICIIFFFILVGPYMKKYDLVKEDPTAAARLGYLTPRIPGLENLGIFDGTKTISRGKRFLHAMYHSEFGEGIIISGLPEEIIEDPLHPDYANVSQITVKVDYYRYINYITSYMPERYFGIIDENAVNGTNNDPLGEVRQTLTKDVFEDYMAKNYIIDIWTGARISLLMAISVLIINTIVGLTLGAIAGYYGGVLDLLFDRLVEIISSIPFLSVLTLLILRYGSALWVIVLAFTATGWIGAYGTGRMQFYRFKNREYVLAARTLGASDGRIMFKHIFPNTLGLIVTGYALAIPAFVFTEASYAFLGIINYSNAVSVGMLIQQGQAVMQVHPHLLIYPALYIAILMIAFNLFGNGLRDAFNPSLRGVE